MFDFVSKTWKSIDDNIEHPEGYEYSPSPQRKKELRETTHT